MLSLDFFNVFKTSLLMMHKRGYDDASNILDEIKKISPNIDFSQVSDNFQNIGWDFTKFQSVDIKESIFRFKNSYVLTNEKDKKKGFVVFGISTKPFLITFTNIILSFRNSSLSEQYQGEFVLILNKSFNSKFTNKLEEIASQIPLQIFLDIELYKPPLHSLGPFNCEKMTPEEITKFLEESHLTRKQLKKVFYTDPIIKYYGFPKKSIIRYYRTPMIGGNLIRSTMDYRLVV